MNQNIFDTSEELLIQRFQNGVRLIKPEMAQSSLDPMKRIKLFCVRSLFEMPFNVYFLNTQSVIQNMSERTANICGFQGRNDAIGKIARTVSKKESAEFSIRHNNEVISHNSMVIKDEHFLRLDGYEFHDVAIKFPLLNADGEIMGVFGCSIIIDSLALSLNLLMQTGLFAPSTIYERNNKEKSIYLNLDSDHHELDHLRHKLSVKSKQSVSRREAECLMYLMKGKSARETGVHINLSQRTVEHYLNILKDKLNCTKKSEIIDKVFALLKN
jgi:DNA-binding CsgD family transcriptional regulator